MSYIVPKEKPKCFNCPFRTLDYCGLLTEHDSVTVNVNEMSVSDYCPLVEIPTPHGRLIDADKLDCLFWHDTGGCFEDGVLWVVNKIDELPPIIEAEGSEE